MQGKTEAEITDAVEMNILSVLDQVQTDKIFQTEIRDLEQFCAVQHYI